VTLITNLSGQLDFILATSAGAQYKPIKLLLDSLATGVGLDQADVLYFKEDVALSGSATNTLDFSGSVADEFNTTIAVVKVKVFYFHNKSTTAGNTITLGGNANEMRFWSAAGTKTVGPNGRVLYWEPSLAELP